LRAARTHEEREQQADSHGKNDYPVKNEANRVANNATVCTNSREQIADAKQDDQYPPLTLTSSPSGDIRPIQIETGIAASGSNLTFGTHV